MLDTSGAMVTLENDGSFIIQYVDYNVGFFGGASYEVTIEMDKENSDKFQDALRKKYRGSIEKMIKAAFTKKFKEQKFRDFCKENDIKYERSSWTSYD